MTTKKIAWSENAGPDKAEESAGLEDARRYVTLTDGSTQHENGKHHDNGHKCKPARMEYARRDNSGHLMCRIL